MRDLGGSAAVVLPDHQVVPQHHHPAVLRVVALVAGTLLPPDVELQRHVIMHPQPFSLPPQVSEADVPVTYVSETSLQDCQLGEKLNLQHGLRLCQVSSSLFTGLLSLHPGEV